MWREIRCTGQRVITRFNDRATMFEADVRALIIEPRGDSMFRVYENVINHRAALPNGLYRGH